MRIDYTSETFIPLYPYPMFALNGIYLHHLEDLENGRKTFK